MIHKVKPPPTLRLISSSGQAKNDLGGQSGDAYSKNSSQSEGTQTEPETSPQDEAVTEPSEAEIDGQIGLTSVVKEWLENPKTSSSGMTPAKLSQKYQGESSPSKGMLLNKKIP